MTPVKTIRAPRPRLGGLMDVWPFSADQFQRMVELGIADANEVELVEGFLVGINHGSGQVRPNRYELSEDPPTIDGLELWPLTLDQYQQLVEANVIEEDDPVEMLDGYIVTLERGGGSGMPNPKHSSSTSGVVAQLYERLPRGYVIFCQDSIQLGPRNVAGAGGQPQPDVAVADGPRSRYFRIHPGPRDLRLVVEVGDSSLLTDRRFKRVRYAKSGIPIYWIVNLVDRRLEVYRDPDTKKGEYRTEELYNEDQSVVLAWEGLDPVTFAVAEFLA